MDIKFIHEQLANDLAKVLGKQLAILGCGAIGANLAISLARRGFNNFLLVDYDKIQDHNISTQPWSNFDISSLKVKVLSEYLHQIGDMNITSISKKIEKVGQIIPLLSNNTIIIDSFDNRAARKVTHELNPPFDVLHVGMSAENTAEITWDEHYTLPQDMNLGDPCNYPLARTLIELSIVTAAEVVISFLLTKQKYSYLIKANGLSIIQI
jgi:sulfur carrier protein ThiS adenylyltransferase